MLTRIGLLAIAAVAISSAPAGAQCMQRQMAAARMYAASYSPQLPSIDQLARQSYGNYGGYEQGCATAREQQMQARTAQMQQRRDAEQARRKAAREQLAQKPRPVPNPETQAAAKYELAHMLWKGGNATAAQKWLGEIMDKFPNTQTADRARQTLARL